ncbi:MAG: hypothetical protein IT245_07320 [Bacteroidia bacterium]|nr:hypothetical protein [Bacteroidia bacterium]
MFTEIFDKILSLLHEKRETIFGVLIVALLCFTIYAQYGYTNEDKASYQAEIAAAKTKYDEDIKILRVNYINAQVEFNEEISSCHRDCRAKVDSLEEFYFNEFRKLQKKVNNIDNRINQIVQ